MKILVRFLYTHLPCPGVSPKLLDEGFWIQDAEEDCGIRQYQTHKAVGLWPHEARSSYLISSDNQDIYVQKGSKEIFRKWKSKRHTVPWYLPFGELWCFFYCTFLLNLEFVDDGPQKEQNPLVKCLWDLGFTRGNTSRKSWNSTGMPKPKNEMPFQLCLNKWPWIWFCICILGVGDIWCYYTYEWLGTIKTYSSIKVVPC